MSDTSKLETDAQDVSLSAECDSALAYLMFSPHELQRLRQTSKRLAKRKMILPAVSSRILFDSLFSPRRLSLERQTARVAKYFWGYRRNHHLDELIVEAAMLTDLSPWRMASIAARHQENGEVFDRSFVVGEAALLCRVIETLGDCPRALAELALDDNASVRTAVTENVCADLHTMFLLAEDRSPDVRYALAENHNAPIAVLQFLSDDGNPYVAARAQRTLSRLISADAHSGLISRLTRKARRKATA